MLSHAFFRRYPRPVHRHERFSNKGAKFRFVCTSYRSPKCSRERRRARSTLFTRRHSLPVPSKLSNIDFSRLGPDSFRRELRHYRHSWLRDGESTAEQRDDSWKSNGSGANKIIREMKDASFFGSMTDREARVGRESLPG